MTLHSDGENDEKGFNRKKNTEIEAANVVTGSPPERQPTSMQTAHASNDIEGRFATYMIRLVSGGVDFRQL